MKTAEQLIKEKYGYKSVRVLEYNEAIEFATEYALQVAEAVRDKCRFHCLSGSSKEGIDAINLNNFIK